MREKLQTGYEINTMMGGKVIVGNHIGSGGRGDIYTVSYQGQEKILKWYRPKGVYWDSGAFYDITREKPRQLKKNPNVISPIDVTERVDGTFGVVMEFIPPEYKALGDYLPVKERLGSFKATVDAALHIVSAFCALHSCGYCLQGATDGSILIEPGTGNAMLVDHENIFPSGMDAHILSAPRFAAPEVVLRKALPDMWSDRFTMAELLFLIFCLNHPLEGKRSLVPVLTPELQEQLYGSEALFIMEPNDRSNAPDPVVHRNSLAGWICLPDYMREIFLKAFSQEAITTPHDRPTELEWMQALTRFRSDIVSCACGNEIFTQNGRSCKCDECGRMSEITFRLDFSAYSIPAIEGKHIYLCQTGCHNAEEALTPVGQIVSKKGAPNILGVKNQSGCIWDAVTSKGTAKKIMPNGIIPLKDGIRFTPQSSSCDNGAAVEIKANQYR